MGDLIVAGYRDSTIRSYSAVAGEALWKIDNAHKRGVTTVNLAQNMRFVLSGGEEGELRVWELKTKEMIAHLKEHNLRVNCSVLFSNDQYAISCGRDRSLITWDLRNEKRLTLHKTQHGGLNHLALGSDQTEVATVTQEKSIVFWDLREANAVGTLEVEEEMFAIAMSPDADNRSIATGGSGHVVKLWDHRNMQGGPVAIGKGHSKDIQSLAFAADRKQPV